MANSIKARFNNNCKVEVAMSDDTTVTKAVIIDADGVETEIGGGGSSDFSTAEVTIVGGEDGLALSGGVEGWSNGYIFIKSDEYGDTGITLAGAQAETSITAKALLFKNLDETFPHDFAAVFGAVEGTAIESVEGNCELDEDTGIVIIWGDCTITGGTPK